MGPFRDRKRWHALEPKRERDKRLVDPALFALLRAVVILMFGILVLQLINLQVIKGAEFRRKAEINALREVPELSARGLIYDRNSRALVQNSARFSAAIIAGDLPDHGEAGIYRALEPVLNMPAADIEGKVKEGVDKQGPYSPAIVKQDIDRDTALTLMELEPHAPGLKVLVEPTRQYTTGALLSHVLGYVGPVSADEYQQLKDKGRSWWKSTPPAAS